MKESKEEEKALALEKGVQEGKFLPECFGFSHIIPGISYDLDNFSQCSEEPLKDHCCDV